jgi:hypothetical protein
LGSNNSLLPIFLQSVNDNTDFSLNVVSRAFVARVIICVRFFFKRIVILRGLNKGYLVQTSKQVIKVFCLPTDAFYISL